MKCTRKELCGELGIGERMISRDLADRIYWPGPDGLFDVEACQEARAKRRSPPVGKRIRNYPERWAPDPEPVHGPVLLPCFSTLVDSLVEYAALDAGAPDDVLQTAFNAMHEAARTCVEIVPLSVVRVEPDTLPTALRRLVGLFQVFNALPDSPVGCELADQVWSGILDLLPTVQDEIRDRQDQDELLMAADEV